MSPLVDSVRGQLSEMTSHVARSSSSGRKVALYFSAAVRRFSPIDSNGRKVDGDLSKGPRTCVLDSIAIRVKDAHPAR